MQIEYPFRGYNLFYYVYVLSHYENARKDMRFLEAFHALEQKTENGKIPVERCSPEACKAPVLQERVCERGSHRALEGNPVRDVKGDAE